jgi:hypothetical protein
MNMLQCRRIGLVLLVLAVTSCSEGPSGRVDVWGTVTFKNQPVPAGMIVINPDLSKGNDGPQGLAEIRNGRFDTRTLEKGAPRGPVVFMIDGFDGVPQGELPSGKPLFIGYKLPLELPDKSSEKNIEVPESAAAKGKAGYGPLP